MRGGLPEPTGPNGENHMNNYVTGSTIKLLREKKEYTQRQLAEKLMVSDKAVSKWEHGETLPESIPAYPFEENGYNVTAQQLKLRSEKA